MTYGWLSLLQMSHAGMTYETEIGVTISDAEVEEANTQVG